MASIFVVEHKAIGFSDDTFMAEEFENTEEAANELMDEILELAKSLNPEWSSVHYRVVEYEPKVI